MALFVLVQSDGGRHRLAGWLSPVLSAATGYGVEIEDIGPGLPSGILIGRLTLADGEGVWLTLDRLSLRWRPAELLWRRLSIDAVDVDRIDLARLPATASPQPQPEPKTGGFTIPRLPVGVRLDRLAVGALILGRAVVGEAAQLRLDGRLAAPVGEGIETEITIDRTDGAQGRVAVDARLDPVARRLHLDASVDEAEHGLIVGLLGLAPYPPVHLRVAGDGPLEDWRGTVDADAPGLGSLAGTLTAAMDPPASHFGFEGGAQWHGDTPPLVRPALEKGVHIALQTQFTQSGPVVVDSLRLEARDLAVDASGRLDPETSAVAAQATVQVGPAALAADAMGGLRFEGMRAEAVVSGRLDAVELAAAGSVSHLSGPDLKSANLNWRASLSPPVDEAQAMQVTVEASEVIAGNPKVGALLGPSPSARLEGRWLAGADAIELHPARIDLKAATLSAGGRVALNDAASDLRLEAIVSDVAALQPVTSLAGAGEVRVAARAQGPIVAGTADVRIDGAGKGLRTGIPAADAALGATPTVGAALRLTPASGLTVADLRLTGANLIVTGEAQTDATYETFTAGAEASVANLAPLARAAGTEATGALHLQAAASGALADPDARLRLDLRNASVAGLTVSDGQVLADATHLGSAPAGEVRIALQTAEGPAEATTGFSLEKGELRLAGLSANGLGMRVSGDLGMQTASGLWQGQVHASLSPSERVPVGESRLSGQADARVRLMPVGGRQTADARLQGSSLVLAGAAGEAVRIGTLDVTARVDDALAAPRIDATAHATGVHAGGDGPFSLDLRASGPVNAIEARIGVDGPPQRLDHLSAALRVDRTVGATVVTVTALDAAAAGYPVVMGTTLRVVTGNGRLQIGDVDLAIGAGRVGGRLDLSAGSTAATVRLQAVPVAILRGWLPSAPTGGTLSGDGQLATSDGVVGGTVALALDDVTFAAGEGSTTPALDARVRADVGRTATRVQITTMRDSGGAAAAPPLLVADLVLPLRPVPGALDVQVSRDAPLAGNVAIRAELARVAEALGLSNQRVAGRLAGDLRLGGSLAQPEVIGALVMSDGLYENFVTGTEIHAITARAEIAEGRSARLTLSGTPAGGGSISADGRIAFGSDGTPDIEIAIHTRDARLVGRDDVTATFGGDLSFRRDAGGSRLGGNLTVTPVEVRLRDRLPPSVVVLPVIEINRPGGDTQPGSADAAPGVVVELDLRVEMPRRVFVRGRGLESEWAGALHVTGTSAAPAVAGEIHVVRGDFTFASKRLRLQKGSVQFTGGTVIDPWLDIAAQYQTSDLTAVIGVTGPVSDPTLTVTSQPSLPESEVLAQVMFGKEASRLSPLEAVQLAAAIDSLRRGDTWTAEVFGSIRQFLGLDVINVDQGTGTESGPGLEVGRYFGEHVYVGARRGIGDQTSSGRVEVEIFPGLSLQSDILQDVEGMSGSIGLQFKHDY